MTSEQTTANSKPLEEKAGLTTRRWELAAYAGLLVTAGAMRLWDLGSRALHHDESLHAFYSWGLSMGEGYKHIPMMHGPFQFEANAAVFFAFGDSDYTARLLYALLGTALVGLPYLFRFRLGRLGAILVATLLAFSPTMLYFSRFARNDILMAVWTLGLAVCMWRYIDEGRHRYLYISAALLALAFATKETAYLNTAILGLFLVLVLVPRFWNDMRRRVHVGEVSPPVAILRIASGVLAVSQRKIRLSEVSRPAGFLILLVTLTLPLWSAFVSVFQDTFLLSWSNLVLAAPEAGTGQTGAPSGGGVVIAGLVVAVLLGLSLQWGFRWNWSVWWRSALIFYGIWALLYTTFFTNGWVSIEGMGSGVWRSLGYWIAQQEVARGAQPWYYFFVISSVYEYLPLLFGLIAAVYYMRRNDLFGQFLVFWAVATFILHTVASEKMPWLLVGVALPLIVLSGKFLADMFRSIQWGRLISGGGIFLLPGVPLLLYLMWQIAFYEPRSSDLYNAMVLILAAVVLVGMMVLGVYLARRSGPRNFAAFATVPVALILLVLSIQTGFRASYKNADVPVEMIVYTQTSPDIPRLVSKINRARADSGQEGDLPITIDSTSGFTWPWAWYLRDYNYVSYSPYSPTPLAEAPDSAVLLVHTSNQQGVSPALKERYTEGERIKHRWWFPEGTYRGLTMGKFLRGFADRDVWRSAMDYFLYRRGIDDRLGSEDAYVYFDQGLAVDYSQSE